MPVSIVERPDAVEGVGLLLGGHVARALLGHRVDDDRAVDPLRADHRVADLLDVVTVDRADVLDAELLEEHARHE